MFLDVDPLGLVEVPSALLERIEITKQRLQKYKKCLVKYESDFGSGSSPVGSRLESTAAFAYKGMRRYATHNLMANGQWFSSASDREMGDMTSFPLANGATRRNGFGSFRSRRGIAVYLVVGKACRRYRIQ